MIRLIFFSIAFVFCFLFRLLFPYFFHNFDIVHIRNVEEVKIEESYSYSEHNYIFNYITILWKCFRENYFTVYTALLLYQMCDER